MMIKYRVHEVAKDLNVPSKEIIDLLQKHFGEVKKHMTALTEEELDVIFEHYTQLKALPNFDAYFAENKTVAEDQAAQAAEAMEKAKAADGSGAGQGCRKSGKVPAGRKKGSKARRQGRSAGKAGTERFRTAGTEPTEAQGRHARQNHAGRPQASESKPASAESSLKSSRSLRPARRPGSLRPPRLFKIQRIPTAWFGLRAESSIRGPLT